ncbi:hypothetical protein HaLaN_11232 [Haematococcus lacustris]|uniref:Secreted protein n=1 Tax=Haematococcus lacustris TaxID=44745 RepID=A0A699YZE0_HAELA|nr:hypothetical protein HaLaN_11232 [Haematococcus lacustris]
MPGTMGAAICVGHQLCSAFELLGGTSAEPLAWPTWHCLLGCLQPWLTTLAVGRGTGRAEHLGIAAVEGANNSRQV